MPNKHKTHFRLSVLYWLLLLLPLAAWGQPSDRNYVRTLTALDALGSHSVTEVQYYDGLGRPSVYATNGLGTAGRFAYAVTAYNEAGLPRRLYSPAVAGTIVGYFDEGSVSTPSHSTYQDSRAYSQTTYDVLGRERSVTGPGEAWHDSGRNSRKTYASNNAGSVKRYRAVGAAGSIVAEGYHEAGTLYSECLTDEDGRTLQVFHDRRGRKVLERRDGNADTYFVYNTAGQLRYVLTPEYQAHPHKDLFAYEYRYNSRGLLDKKLLPQSGYVQYWYDGHNRLVSMQDPQLRERGKYRFFLYDRAGRQAIEGVCDNFNYNNPCVVDKATGDGWLGTGYGYAHYQGVSHPRVEVVCYYDDYSFLAASCFSSRASVLAASAGHSARGLLTGCYNRTSSGDAVLCAIYYDEKGQPRDIRKCYPGGRSLTTAVSYSHTGKPLVETARLQTATAVTTATKTTDYYNSNDRPHSLSLSFGGQSAQVAVYSYDDLGRLSSVQRGGAAGAVTYGYNVRGWLTGVDSPPFKEWLCYTDGAGTPQYGGNVSSLQWQVAGESFRRGYRFLYDGQCRMLKADYAEGIGFSSNAGRYSEWVPEYTRNGAPRKIERWGLKSGPSTYGKIDNLRMYHTGVQLDSVKEDALPLAYAGAFDFVSQSAAGVGGRQYGYYGDGSLKWDSNKGIAMIGYDLGGHPRRVQFTNGSVTEYRYSSGGERLATVYRTAVPNISVPVGTTLELDDTNTLSVDSVSYVGDFILENGQPRKYLFDGGYVSLAGGQPSYHYYTRDHLGNVRTVSDHNGAVEQVNHYYPFGAVYSSAGMNDALQPYKYNGKELDRMHGLNLYDYGARQYDPMLCLFTQMDRKAEKYYNISPYAYCGGNPVNAIDVNGDSIYYDMPIISRGSILGYTRFVYGQYGDVYGFGRNGELFQGGNYTMAAIAGSIDFIRKNGSYGSSLVNFLSGSTFSDVLIKYGAESSTFYPTSKNKNVKVYWNPLDWEGAGVDIYGSIFSPPFIALGHELIHAADYLSGTPSNHTPWFYLPNGSEIQKKELDTSIRENYLRKENGIPARKFYVNYSNTNIGYAPSLINNFWW